MSRRIPRLHAVVAAALILFGNARGMFGALACPRHDGPSGATHGQHAEHAAQTPAAPHQHHDAAAQAETPPADTEQGGPCTCLDHCQACQFAVLAVAPAAIAETSVLLTSRISSPPAARLPGRAPHQLPFATAPPAIA